MNWPRPFEKSAFVPQRDETDCGAACLAIVLKRLSLPCPTVAEIRDLAGTNRVRTRSAGRTALRPESDNFK